MGKDECRLRTPRNMLIAIAHFEEHSETLPAAKSDTINIHLKTDSLRADEKGTKTRSDCDITAIPSDPQRELNTATVLKIVMVDANIPIH